MQRRHHVGRAGLTDIVERHGIIGPVPPPSLQHHARLLKRICDQAVSTTLTLCERSSASRTASGATESGRCGRHQRKHVDAAIGDQFDRGEEFRPEAERAAQVDLLGHDSIRRHRDLPARQIADLDHDAAAPDDADGAGKARGRARDFERDIERTRRGLGLQRLLAAGDIDDMIGAEPGGKRQRRRRDIDDGRLRDPCALRRQHGQQADGTGAEQHGALAGDVAGAGDRMQAHRERLGERRRLIGHVIGNLHALRRDGVEVGRKAALHMRGLRGRAHEEDVFAEIGPVLAARLAMAAPARRIEGDAVADLHAGCGAGDLDDFARDLVAEHQRRGHDEIAGAGVAIVMHVGAANAAGAETDAHHA